MAPTNEDLTLATSGRRTDRPASAGRSNRSPPGPVCVTVIPNHLAAKEIFAVPDPWPCRVLRSYFYVLR